MKTKLFEASDELKALYKRDAESERERKELSMRNQRLMEEARLAKVEVEKSLARLTALSLELEGTREALAAKEGALTITTATIMQLRATTAEAEAECERCRSENAALIAGEMERVSKFSSQVNAVNAVLDGVRRERDSAVERLAAERARCMELSRKIEAAGAAPPLPPSSSAAGTAAPLASSSSISTETTPSSSMGSGGIALFSKVQAGFSSAAKKAAATAAAGMATLSGSPALPQPPSAGPTTSASSPGQSSGGGSSSSGTALDSVVTSGRITVSYYALPNSPSCIIDSGPAGGGGAAAAAGGGSSSSGSGGEGEINAVCFNASGSLVAIARGDGIVAIHDTSTGSMRAKLGCNNTDAAVLCLLWVDGQLLGGCSDKSVVVWDLHTMRIARTLTGHNNKVTSLALVSSSAPLSALSSSGGGARSGTIVTGSADRSCRLWSLNDGRCVRAIDTKSIVNSVDASSDGMSVVCGNQDSGVRLYDVRNGAKLAENTTAHPGPLASVAFCVSDGCSRLLTSCRDNALRVLHGRSLEQVLVGGAESTAASIFAPPLSGASSSSSAAPSSSSAVPVVMRHPSFRMPQLHNVNALWSPSGAYAVAGGMDGFVYAWAGHSGDFVEAVGDEKAKRKRERAAARERARTSGSGTESSPGSSFESAPSSTTAASDDRVPEAPHRGHGVLALGWSADGRFLASGDDHGRTVLWEGV